MLRIPRALGCLVCLSAVLTAATYDVRDFGAKGDGIVQDTAAIQAAIDAAAKDHGGVVMAPAGNYLCGTLTLKSGITFHLAAGATLLMSKDNNDFAAYERLPFVKNYRERPTAELRASKVYPLYDDEETTYFHFALLAGDGVENVSITGAGTVDGNRTKRGGPKSIAFKNSRHISIRGITIQNSPNYAISLLGTDYVDVDGVTILNSYADGIDPDNCHYVRIANVYVDSADDAICPKASWALGRPRSTENLVVTNCILRTNSAAFKFGTETRGDFKNIAVSNCVVLRRDKGSAPTAGISIHSVDGAQVDGVVISNITMQGARSPIFLRLGNRGRGLQPPQPGSMKNISISNVVATGANLPVIIAGLPGHRIRDVSLSDISVVVNGGASFPGPDVPEDPGAYPNARHYADHLPAYALYARHMEGLTIRNLKTRWLEPDRRPALFLEDVRDLELSGFHAASAIAPQPLLWFSRVAGALVRGSRPTQEAVPFLKITGAESRDIALVGNDLSQLRKVVVLGPGVSGNAFVLAGNAGQAASGKRRSK